MSTTSTMVESPPPNHTDDETPSSRRNSNALTRWWAASSSPRRSSNRPVVVPAERRPSGLPDVAAAARRRPQEQPPPGAGHGRGRDLQDDPLPRDRNRRHHAAPVRVRRRGSWSAVRPVASLCRLPRGRLVLLLLRARIAGVADDSRQLDADRLLLVGDAPCCACLVSCGRQGRGREGRAHGTTPVHRSNDDRGALFFDEERLLMLLSLSHACFVWAPSRRFYVGETMYSSKGLADKN